MIGVNPMNGVKTPRGVRDVEVEFYTTEYLASLYETTSRRASLWRLAVNTGIRYGKFAKACRSDIAIFGKIRDSELSHQMPGIEQGRGSVGKFH